MFARASNRSSMASFERGGETSRCTGYCRGRNFDRAMNEVAGIVSDNRLDYFEIVRDITLGRSNAFPPELFSR